MIARLRHVLGKWRGLGKGAAVFLCCLGLSVVSVLAPLGVARMRGGTLFPRLAPEVKDIPPSRSPEEAAASALQSRFHALVDGDAERLRPNYDLESDSGLWSWEKEAWRARYLKEWAEDRGLEVFEAKAAIEIDTVYPGGSDAVWVEATEHATYSYRPLTRESESSDWAHTFGSRAVHVLELVLVEGDWKIRRDWYVDPIGQESYMPPCRFTTESGPEAGGEAGEGEAGGSERQEQPAPLPVPESPPGKYARDAARDYAIAHAGVPAIEGAGRYNHAYRVYTFAGGDCANFASQVLHAGGLEQGSGWHYTSEGSAAWVRGEDLVWHLLATGRAKRLYTGSFAGAVKRTPEAPLGLVSLLEPGDIIGYESKGQICHVAVVVGNDPAGYPVIASHTSDRLFFPWDMGWNDNTVFWLIKITY